MSEFKIQMPKLGESVQEATITKWFVKEGDKIEEDQSIFEVATDKVDSEIPSPVDGVVKKILFEVNSLVPVGETVLIISTGDDEGEEEEVKEVKPEPQKAPEKPLAAKSEEKVVAKTEKPKEEVQPKPEAGVNESKSSRFYSPLVLSIAQSEQVSMSELESIQGSGLNGRVQKDDILSYIEERKKGKAEVKKEEAVPAPQKEVKAEVEEKKEPVKAPVSMGGNDQIIEMDRVR
ncbi:MAG: E3 binding domain-containing protein, partial [Verrucomicrobia bacterium]|nr:E3 binding domain-containing protein [Prolixibacteraceae bacterium]